MEKLVLARIGLAADAVEIAVQVLAVARITEINWRCACGPGLGAIPERRGPDLGWRGDSLEPGFVVVRASDEGARPNRG
ncbi:hypothetical protein DSM104635_02851 [Terricaulis silvestris]|uniref:Uncharacterized protein n=1 Tax=Terricaulis silvestris TaxID=2686094 RepID=A0A6I6MKW1_9CAUL|nr:hypothetical protein DSM104635_02851 [Terricaulis silvestris]